MTTNVADTPIDHQPSVSIIVNTLGRATLLADCLRGLEMIEWPALEVVVVSGPSDDGTRELLDRWTGRIKLESCPDANLARSRNIGLSLSSGEIVAFIDDDAVPHPLWIAELVKPYRDSRVGAVGGHTVGRQGTIYQARRTLCDRFGDPKFVSSQLDLAPFNAPGSWFFPVVLGTNASFRRSALVDVGGFDEVFAYYLEETDLCLRLVDAGWTVADAPRALVWHQFASSALRSGDMTRRSIRAILQSHSYFINRHGLEPWSPDAALAGANRLVGLRQHWLGGSVAALREGAIDASHAARLDRELDEALKQGRQLAQERFGRARGDWLAEAAGPIKPFLRDAGQRFTVAFVCRYLRRDSESGIPRWTRLAAEALAARGHGVHIICEADGGVPCTRFVDGVWTHEINSDRDDYKWVIEAFGLPSDQAQWAASVRRHVETLASFGIDLVSFPIWDLEGLACLGLEGPSLCMSLHTTYALSLPHRLDWQMQPLLRDRLVDRMMSAERLALQRVPHLLANSRSIIREIEEWSDLDLAAKTRSATHGVPIPDEIKLPRELPVLFVGRFEGRKGVDIAVAAIAHAARHNDALRAVFVGGHDLVAALPAGLAQTAQELIASGRIEVGGIVSRAELEQLFGKSALALLPSRYESFGLVAAEALAHGCPVLTVAGSGIAEIVKQDIEGSVVPNDEYAAERLGDSILALLSDTERLAKMGAAAHTGAQLRLGIAQMGREVEAAFKEFLARDSRQGHE